jgi:hypothetical protein
MDWRRGKARFDQFDAPTIDDLMIGRCGHCDGPTEVMSDRDAHAADSLLVPRRPQRQVAGFVPAIPP